MIIVFRRPQGGKPEDSERGGSGKWLMRPGLVILLAMARSNILLYDGKPLDSHINLKT